MPPYLQVAPLPVRFPPRGRPPEYYFYKHKPSQPILLLYLLLPHKAPEEKLHIPAFHPGSIPGDGFACPHTVRRCHRTDVFKILFIHFFVGICIVLVLLPVLHKFCKLWHYLIQIVHNTVMGRIEYLRFRITVDGHNTFGTVHT